MNIVVEDAVEVKQISKTNKEETRRPLGLLRPHPKTNEERCIQLTIHHRPDPPQGRQRLAHPERIRLNKRAWRAGTGRGRLSRFAHGLGKDERRAALRTSRATENGNQMIPWHKALFMAPAGGLSEGEKLCV
jgi:hypothetical protein